MSPSAPSPSAAGALPASAREALADAALLAVDALLTAGAALRVTRFATTDVLGGWVLADPARRWAERNDPRPAGAGAGADPRDPRASHPFGYAAPPEAWRHRLVSALDCPYCVGTQATIAIGAALALTSSRSRRRSPLGRALRYGAATLAAAYVVGHVSYRIDSAAPALAPATKDSK